MAINFELLFEHLEGDIHFSLIQHGITKSRNKVSWSKLEPELQRAIDAVEKAELEQLDDQNLLELWCTVIGRAIGDSASQKIIAAAPANLTIAVGATIPESYYELFRAAPWEQAMESLGSPESPAELQPLLQGKQVTLVDVRIDQKEQARAISVAGIEQVPPSLDFYSDTPDEDAEGTHFPVWFGTNRELRENDGEVYEVVGELTKDRIHVGRCEVWIPKTHRRGELKSPWYRPESILRSDELRLTDMTLLESVVDSIRSAIEQDATTNHLLFIHGFNSSFNEAILRAAQIGFDLGIDGATIAFSWPSRRLFSVIPRYVGDGEVISGSEQALVQLTEQLEGLEGKLNVIAHSMGNRALIRVWESMFKSVNQMPTLEVGQVVFAAPDVFQAAFKNCTEGIDEFCERATVYANRRDYALGLSRLLSQTNRAGLLPPVMSLDQIETVEVSFDLAKFGHTYFAKLIPLLDDLASLIEHNEAPGTGERSQLQRNDEPPGHWSFQ